MPFVKLSDQTRIWYDVVGSGPYLVLNHGYGSSHKNFKRLLPILSESFSCILWDQRGHGQSDMPIRETYEETRSIYTINQLARDCYELLCLLDIAESSKRNNLFIFGVSMGGMVSQVYALNHPETLKAMVLAATTSRTNQPISSVQKKGKIPLASDGRPLQVELGFTKKFLKNRPEFQNKEIREDFLVLGNNLIVMPENIFGNFNVEHKLSLLNFPILLIHGDRDEVMNLQSAIKLDQLLPHSELITLLDVHHNINKEAPDIVAKSAYDFFQKFI